MPKVVKRKPQEKLNLNTLRKSVAQYLEVRRQREQAESREGKLKKQLSEAVETHGYEGDKGSLFLDLESEVDGISVLKRERRVSRRMNEDKAESVLKKRKLLDRCTKTVVVLDEEEIAKVTFEGLVSTDEYDSMFEESVTWAFKPLRS